MEVPFQLLEEPSGQVIDTTDCGIYYFSTSTTERSKVYSCLNYNFKKDSDTLIASCRLHDIYTGPSRIICIGFSDVSEHRLTSSSSGWDSFENIYGFCIYVYASDNGQDFKYNCKLLHGEIFDPSSFIGVSSQTCIGNTTHIGDIFSLKYNGNTIEYRVNDEISRTENYKFRQNSTQLYIYTQYNTSNIPTNFNMNDEIRTDIDYICMQFSDISNVDTINPLQLTSSWNSTQTDSMTNIAVAQSSVTAIWYIIVMFFSMFSCTMYRIIRN
jgi:hypothetical protein